MIVLRPLWTAKHVRCNSHIKYQTVFPFVKWQLAIYWLKSNKSWEQRSIILNSKNNIKKDLVKRINLVKKQFLYIADGKLLKKISLRNYIIEGYAKRFMKLQSVHFICSNRELSGVLSLFMSCMQTVDCLWTWHPFVKVNIRRYSRTITCGYNLHLARFAWSSFVYCIKK